jgi:hypothetical protein
MIEAHQPAAAQRQPTCPHGQLRLPLTVVFSDPSRTCSCTPPNRRLILDRRRRTCTTIAASTLGGFKTSQSAPSYHCTRRLYLWTKERLQWATALWMSSCTCSSESSPAGPARHGGLPTVHASPALLLLAPSARLASHKTRLGEEHRLSTLCPENNVILEILGQIIKEVK